MTKYVVGALALCALVGCGSVDEVEAQQVAEVELASETQALGVARLNVNYATVAGLDALPGVSPSLAAAIVAEREQNGVFWTRAGLLRVPGMRTQVYAGLKERVKVGGCFSGRDCGADERCMLRDETQPWLGGVCYPQASCANVRCAGGSCVMSTAQCSGAACAPSPVCQPEEQTSGCAAVLCAEGTVCVMKQVQCVTAPCPEQPVCEAPAEACMCTREYDPVCGSDGKTYGNPCTARCAGVSFNAGECGAETCMCPQVYEPVCGADGKTYGNACMANCAKVSAVAGACR